MAMIFGRLESPFHGAFNGVLTVIKRLFPALLHRFEAETVIPVHFWTWSRSHPCLWGADLTWYGIRYKVWQNHAEISTPHAEGNLMVQLPCASMENGQRYATWSE
jgi:hypothetical protein